MAKDYQLLVALQMQGFKIDIAGVELIKNTIKVVEEKGDSFSIEDANKIRLEIAEKYKPKTEQDG